MPNARPAPARRPGDPNAAGLDEACSAGSGDSGDARETDETGETGVTAVASVVADVMWPLDADIDSLVRPTSRQLATVMAYVYRALNSSGLARPPIGSLMTVERNSDDDRVE